MLGEQVKSVALFKRAVFAGAHFAAGGSKKHRYAVVRQYYRSNPRAVVGLGKTLALIGSDRRQNGRAKTRNRRGC